MDARLPDGSSEKDERCCELDLLRRMVEDECAGTSDGRRLPGWANGDEAGWRGWRGR